jgi:signal transduction histidine kinase
MYARLGPRIAFVCIGGAVVLAALTGLGAMFMGARYLRLDTEKALLMYAAAMPLVAAGGLAGVLASAPIIRAQLSWRGEATAERAAELWEATVSGALTVVRRACTGAAATLLPVAVVVPVVFDLPAYSAPVLLAGFALALAAWWALVAFGTELVLRPMAEDIARYLPEDFTPRARAWRLRTKALAPLPVVAAFSAMTTGAFSDLERSGPIRLAIALAIAVGTVVVAGAMFLVITRSVLDPVDDLLDATRRVREGDTKTRVPLVTADDLGELAQSFNEMLAGLRERESLREHNVALVENLRRHTDELRESRARIVAAADAERRRVERDLHDGAQQHLVLLNLKLSVLRRVVGEDPDAAALVDELRGDLGHALRELRDLAHGIYPALLENEGLPGALRQAVERAGIPASLSCDGASRYRPELEAAVYFCCLEALQNAAKHAGDGARATVRLAERDGALVFEVADDGRGFVNADVSADSAGLQNMADRIGALGGSVRVESAPGEGTMVTGAIRLA